MVICHEAAGPLPPHSPPSLPCSPLSPQVKLCADHSTIGAMQVHGDRSGGLRGRGSARDGADEGEEFERKGGVLSQHQERSAYACTRLVSSRQVTVTGGFIRSDCAIGGDLVKYRPPPRRWRPA